MAKNKIAIGQDRRGWKVGERVARRDTNEQGTIFQADGEIAVRWDGGATSYYDRETPANVELLRSPRISN